MTVNEMMSLYRRYGNEKAEIRNKEGKFICEMAIMYVREIFGEYEVCAFFAKARHANLVLMVKRNDPNIIEDANGAIITRKVG